MTYARWWPLSALGYTILIFLLAVGVVIVLVDTYRQSLGKQYLRPSRINNQIRLSKKYQIRLYKFVKSTRMRALSIIFIVR